VTAYDRADGNRIVYRAGFDVREKEIGGAGRERVLFTDRLFKTPSSWSADMRFILHLSHDELRRDDDLWVLPLAAGAKPFRFTKTPSREFPGRFSPDGRWIAYASNESGQNEVSVAPFPGPGAKWPICTAGGVDPRWRRDGKELFFVAPDGTIMAAQVTGGSTGFTVGAITPLFKTRGRGARYMYDVTPDGQRFLVNTLVSESGLDSIEVVINWTEALEHPRP